ncbi:MAG: phosphotransferase [Candidatus Baltobacteraceae bacterium]
MLAAIAGRFALEGEYLGAERYDGGHINDTYFASYRLNGSVTRYVHQRINTRVFQDAHALARNVSYVTAHMRSKLLARGIGDVERRVLQIVRTRDGHDLLVTKQGEHWRTYVFVEGTASRTRVESAGDAYAAAFAFGEFAALLADLPVSRLHETIPGFHDTPARYARFAQAAADDVCGRAKAAQAEAAQAHHLAHLAPALIRFAAENGVPLRATHNDTKITNVLFDARSGDAVCVVDLDTVMPGLTLYDAGELIRTAATRSAEDEPDARNVVVEPELLDAVLAGSRAARRRL